MNMRSSIRSKLDRAVQARHVVRVLRKPRFADPLDGIIMRVGRRWALIAQTVDGGYFDGIVAFRLQDVTRIVEDETFATAFARTRPEWPPTLDRDVDLDDISILLEGIAPADTLLGIQEERERSAIWIGVLDEVTHRYVYLREVRPDATWHAVPLGYRLKAITSVEVGTRYLTSLAAIAQSGTDLGSG